MEGSAKDVATYTEGEEACARALFVENYEVLLGIARQRRRRHGLSDTLQTTALVHEAFLKLDSNRVYADGDHFIAASALAIRHVIVDYVRGKLTARRGQGQANIAIDDDLPEFSENPEEIAQIADLLDRLGEENPRWLRIVDARYFAGMTEDETAEMMGLSTRTVRRDWKEARGWIRTKLAT